MKKRVTYKKVPLDLSDFNGYTPDQILKYLNDTCREHCEGRLDVACYVEAEQYYEDVTISLCLTRIESDDEYLKRLNREQQSRERNAKRNAARRKAKLEERMQKEKAEYETFLKLKKKYGGPVK